MVTVLPAVDRGPSKADRLRQGLEKGVESLAGYLQKKKENEKEEAQKQLTSQAFINAGLDPSAANLPKEALPAYFKQQFATEKPETLLQKSQRELNEQRLENERGVGESFNKLTGISKKQNVPGMEGQPEISAQEQSELSKIPKENLMETAAFAGQPGQKGVVGTMAKNELDRRKDEDKARTDKQKEYFKFNEPKVAELAETGRKLRQEEARYNRLDELFSNPENFPSSLTAALFSKDGQINDLAYSQLTPEAQESIKLIIDSTSNIKDTYGARVTNFDIQTYLKKLPSLLNSPEGKSRVLRDLKIINRLNQLHSSGVQEIFEEAGGTDRIPYSTAEKRYEKRYGPLEKDLIDQFVTPDKGTFEKLPDANRYLGKKIKNPETGEIFISDGKEWKPFKG